MEKKAAFNLHPYSTSPHEAEMSIAGDVIRDGGRLCLNYMLKGCLDHLAIAPAAPQALRRHELWKETCFEGFLQPVRSSNYWELNLSPAGHWNIYRFSGYRQGMCEESKVTELSVEVRKSGDSLLVSTEVDLSAFGFADLRIGLSAVIRDLEGRLSYWALAHPGPRPDFHRPESFLLQI